MSTLVSRRAVWSAFGLVIVCVAAVVANLTAGDFTLSFPEAMSALMGNGPENAVFAVRELRLPRTLVALAVGAGLGLSGAVFQELAGNPLASPDILGVQSGAAAGAVVAIVVLGESTGAVPFFALAGSLAVTAFIYLFAYRQGLSGYRLILTGIGATAVLGSVTSYLMVQATLDDAERALVWLTGSLGGRGWGHVATAAAGLVLFVPVLLYLVSRLRAIALGDDVATGLGVRTERARAGLIVCAAAMAALSTAAAGPVAFIALASPQIARRIAGSASIAVIPTVLVGGALLVGSDLLARRVFAPNEFPVGVVTAILGAPVLLWLLARHNRRGG